jgi:hypothetical protein
VQIDPIGNNKWMNYKYILLFSIMLLSSCRQERAIQTSFYYWKTVYKQNKIENSYLDSLKSKRLYVRIMDVDIDYELNPKPIAPISFADNVPSTMELVPVVFIVNEVLADRNEQNLNVLAAKITKFVTAKIKQGGKEDFKELQIDCDWTEKTRDNYFKLLEELGKLNQGKVLTTTLRLHQLKNQLKSGIPPVDKVLLMCYNMGNLRKYGTQNSIIDLKEFSKYVDENIAEYPKPVDVALPLFSWTVVFKYGSYKGIAKRVSKQELLDPILFYRQPNGLYMAQKDLPALGISKGDEIRREESNFAANKEITAYLAQHLSKKPLNLIFYHLDETLLKDYKIDELEEIAHILH